MRYKEIEELAEEKFRKLTEVKKVTLERMVKVLDKEDNSKKARGGRKSKLCIRRETTYGTGIYKISYTFSYCIKL